MKQFCEEVHTIPRKKQWSPHVIGKTALSLYPFLMVGHTLPEMKRKIVEVLAGKTVDVIHVETFYVMQNLPKTYLPVVLVEHNIEYKVYEKFANRAAVFIRPLLFADIAKIKYWEEKFWKKATRVVAVSKDEQAKMKGIRPSLVPNGVDVQKFKIQSVTSENNKKRLSGMKGRKVLFIGNFKWIQNQKAALKILDDIWPLIVLNKELRATDFTLWIVGKNIPDKIKAYQSKHIIIDENASEETEKIYHASDILLAPIEVGGGSSYKILEAMASGIPVVTTELGINGIAAVAGEHALVGKSNEELANGVISLLSKHTQYEKIRLAARKFIESTYNWHVIVHALEEVYQEVISQAL